MSYMNQAAQSNVDVTIGATGYNPYRNSQLASTDLWVKAGMPKELAENYIGAINAALNNPNMASDMKIPGAQKYTGVVLDTELARYLAGEITVEEALKNIEAGWEEVTDRHSRTFFIAPAVVLILIFAIFPTFYSIVFALSRVRFTGEGLKFRLVWFQNFAKQFFGNDQVHFLGKIGAMGWLGTLFLAAVIAV